MVFKHHGFAHAITKYISADSAFCWAFSISSMLRHSLNTFLRGLKNQTVERTVKYVGPIWGQHETEEKVKAFMIENGMTDWKWTGCLEFERGEWNKEKIEKAEKYLNRSDFHTQLRNGF